jgi:hypothetical protein
LKPCAFNHRVSCIAEFNLYSPTAAPPPSSSCRPRGDPRGTRDVAVQVAFERQILKPGYHITGSRVETRSFQAQGPAEFNLYSPTVIRPPLGQLRVPPRRVVVVVHGPRRQHLLRAIRTPRRRRVARPPHLRRLRAPRRAHHRRAVLEVERVGPGATRAGGLERPRAVAVQVDPFEEKTKFETRRSTFKVQGLKPGAIESSPRFQSGF